MQEHRKIKPRYLHDEHKLWELIECIDRHLKAECKINSFWIDEYNELCKRKWEEPE
jgi:hypothetical protein